MALCIGSRYEVWLCEGNAQDAKMGSKIGRKEDPRPTP